MRRLPAFALLLNAALATGLPPLVLAQEEPAAEPAPAEQPAPAERVAPQSREEALAAGLQRQLDAAAQLQLGGDERFLALWQPASSARPRGVVIIVPGEGETADWPRVVAPLRHGLAEQGWHTLSLTPADPVWSPGPRLAPQQPPATSDTPSENTTTAAEPASADPVAAGHLPEQTAAAEQDEPAEAVPEADQQPTQPGQAERMQARLAAAVEHARGLQAPALVLLGHGTGAYWAARYLAQSPSKEVGQLVLVDPRLPADAEQPIERDLAQLAVGIGDFQTGSRPAALRQAAQRRDAMRRAGHQDYRQVALANLQGDRYADQQQLVRRVRGWLERETPR